MMSEAKSLEAIFSQAMQFPDMDERRRYVEQACDRDPDLAQQIFSLLQAAQNVGSFLESPAHLGNAADESARQAVQLGSSPSNSEFPFLAKPFIAADLGSLGPYRILNFVGRGGMGIVFRAIDPKLKRVVAVKALSPDIARDPMARKRFEREARSAAAVTHPHVVVIHAVDEIHNPPYLVMEFVQGKTLEEKLATHGALAVKEILRIGSQIAEGLSAAHKQGLVHRDMKPANILLENGVERAKVTDFGLAKTIDDIAMTRTGDLSGTPQFMSPEQAAGGIIDYRTDLFSLGTILYAMCTGRTPFRASNPLAILKRICEETPRPIQQVNPDIPDWLSGIVDRLLAKSPVDRYQSAAEVADLLQQRLTTQQAVLTNSRTELEAKPRSRLSPRKPWSSAIYALGLLAGFSSLVWFTTASAIFHGLLPPVSGRPTTPETARLIAAAPPLAVGSTLSAAEQKPLAFKKPGFAQWIIEVSGMAPQQQVEAVANKLVELNPEFDGTLTGSRSQGKPAIEDGIVMSLGFSSDHVSDLSPVRALPKLKILWCEGSEKTVAKLTDLTPLKGLQLRELSCGRSRVSDLSPLEGMPLEVVDFHQTQVVDLAPLKGMKLAVINIDSTQIKNFSPLEGMPLLALNCPNTPVSDLSPLHQAKLNYFGGNETKVADLAPLRGMPLKEIRLGNTLISDLSSLKGMPLEIVFCGNTAISDLSPLEGMKLVHIAINDTKVVDLRPLSGMKLNGLQMHNTAVYDLSPLKGMPLTTVDAYNTAVMDLSPLQRCQNLNTVNLCHTKVSPREISALQNSLPDCKIEWDGPIQSTDGNHSSAFQQWIKEVAIMPPDQQIKAVSLKLVALNPDFDGKLSGWNASDAPVIENGIVKGLGFITDNVTDISPLKALPQLWFVRCEGSDAGRGKLRDLAPLKVLKLRELKCGNSQVHDLSPLEGMPLQVLSCSNTQISDLAPLKGMYLKVFHCGSTAVFDLSPLRGMPLQALAFFNTPVCEISPLKGMPLEDIHFNSTIISDLTPLQGMKLAYLRCGGTKVTDLSPLSGMMLQGLDCSYTQVTELSPLRGMPLNFFVGADTPIADGSPLQECKKLTRVDLRHCSVSEQGIDALRHALPNCEVDWDGPVKPITDFMSPAFQQWIKSVVDMPAEKQVDAVAKKLMELNPGFDGKVTPTVESGVVTGLMFFTDNVADLSPLRALVGLRMLSCFATQQRGQLADLSPLRGMGLVSLLCSGNRIDDLSPLNGMKLVFLHCNGSKINDLSPLKGMAIEDLHIGDTQAHDLSPLIGMPLASLECGSSQVSDLSPLRGMKLTHLRTQVSNVTDLSPLKGMPLQVLLLFHTRVRDLSPLNGMPLTELAVSYAPIRDLRPITECKNLKALHVSRTQVTAADAAALQQALPNCKFHWGD
jgi:serine/threonine protein kinase/Leucine-rich repeat (LRR) protein